MFNRQELVLGAALCVALPAASLAQATLRAPSGERGWWANETAEAVCVQDREGANEACWSRSLGQLTDLREIPGGWIAAGHGPSVSGRDLFLVRDVGAGLETVAPPEGGDLPRGRPVLATGATGLLGLVWLEGETQEVLELRSARWLGSAWGAVTTASPVGPGSQVAPAITVLDDGRWLVVWTAFDGHDDETVWSAYDGERWSAPAAVHEDNATPDIVPAVLATRHGAIAAWSWLDGHDYRLRKAFFDGSEWRVDPPSGGRGGLYPRLVATAGTHLLSFQTVVPEQWVVYELDEDGRVLHRAAVAGSASERPIVEFEGGAVVFRGFEGEALRETTVPWDTVGERDP